jgi:hypothetical protein
MLCVTAVTKARPLRSAGALQTKNGRTKRCDSHNSQRVNSLARAKSAVKKGPRGLSPPRPKDTQRCNSPAENVLHGRFEAFPPMKGALIRKAS